MTLAGPLVRLPIRSTEEKFALESSARFLQGIYAFDGQGLEKARLLHPAATDTVPAGVPIGAAAQGVS